jgi:hypothetical protein
MLNQHHGDFEMVRNDFAQLIDELAVLRDERELPAGHVLRGNQRPSAPVPDIGDIIADIRQGQAHVATMAKALDALLPTPRERLARAYQKLGELARAGKCTAIQAATAEAKIHRLAGMVR